LVTAHTTKAFRFINPRNKGVADGKAISPQIIGTNAFGNPGDVGVFGECFGLADGYQLVGEVMAHQGDNGLPCCLKVGSQHQSILRISG
jgi:hypothetical protein